MLSHRIHRCRARVWFATGCIIGWLTAAGAVAAPASGTLTQNVNLREGPGTQYRVVTGINAGTPVEISAQQDEWLQISVMKNHLAYKGWVFAGYVKTAAAAPAADPPEITPPPEARAPAAPAPAAPAEPAEAAQGETGTPRPLAPIALPEAPETPTPLPAAAPPVPPSPAADTNIQKILTIAAGVLSLLAIFISGLAMRYAQKYRRLIRELAPGKAENRVLTMQEKRRHPRINRLVEVDFAVEGRFFRGLIDSLSAGGVFIKTTAPQTVGKAITVSYPAPNQAGHIKREGVITRISDIGIAVSFTSPAEDECNAP